MLSKPQRTCRTYLAPIIVAIALSNACCQPRTITLLQPPGNGEYCRLDMDGVSILPNGRYVKPAGAAVRITADPFGLTLSPDGKRALAVHDCVLTVIPIEDFSHPIRYPSYDKKLASPFKEGAFMGVQVSPDGNIAYLSGGNDGTIILFDIQQGRRIDQISLDGDVGGKTYVDSFVGDIALSRDGKRLFLLDQFNFRFVIVDLEQKHVAVSVPVGRFPFGLGIAPDESKAYVANVGIFDYPLIPGVTDQNVEKMGIDFPPYGLPSKEAEEGTMVNGRKLPGLGSPYVPEAVSVWSVDLQTNKVIAKVKTGYQMGERVQGLEVVGGSSPNSIAVGRSRVYVTNATNDNISVLDVASQRIIGQIPITVHPAIDRWRGLIPFGLSLSPDERRLYVALSGLNAIAVVDTGQQKVIGLIPTGWFPTKVAVFPDNRRICVVTARGFGAGPNGGKGFKVPVQGTYVGDIMLGTCELIDVPSAEELARYTRQVVDYTFAQIPITDDGRNPLPPAPKLRKSPIGHIVYITKENRTYDEVFGQQPGGRGDPTLARYGSGVSFANRNGKAKVENATVMPNHQRIARDFAMSDNFYCDSDASVHGHRWMVGTYPNEWVEANAAIRKDARIYSSAPGRRYVAGSSGAIYPEDYNEVGGLWEQLARHQVPFYNFGEGFEFSATEEEENHQFTGIKMKVLFPMPKALFENTSRVYATYNTSVPDQFRVDMFEQELHDKWLSGKEPFPRLITMELPNDHGAGERPDAGYPFKESYMADNDLALGRVLHDLSQTPWWKDMLVIITEDDAQDGRDHIDAHRSVLMMVGPYVKRGYVSHTHANFGSILKTIYLLLDLPPVNQFDATASLLQDFFTDQPDFRPFAAERVDGRIFDPVLVLKRYDRKFDWHKLEGPELDKDDDFRESHREQGKLGDRDDDDDDK